ncbi:MAG: hypothetical protein K2G04_00740, partial [Oscillospiraceae bacterium]|nr:hypothetical protein [Oscillospiraceae bacterium]
VNFFSGERNFLEIVPLNCYGVGNYFPNSNIINILNLRNLFFNFCKLLGRFFSFITLFIISYLVWKYQPFG